MSTTISDLASAIDLDATAIEQGDQRYQLLLQDLQGDILKPNGRKFARYIVFQFTGEKPVVRAWLASIANRYVTSAAQQFQDVNAHRTRMADAGIFGTLSLTVAAYQWLNYDLSQIPRDRQARFIAGMADESTQQLLADPPVSEWEPWARQTMHAVLCLFDDNLTRLAETTAGIVAGAGETARALTIQEGDRRRNQSGHSIEPFGFVDGISQPVFLKEEVPSHPLTGPYNPSAPLSLVLIRDPNGVGSYSHGSFAVYRKLKQDVAGFNQHVADLANHLRIDQELAAAYVVGRFRDGTPVISSDKPLGQARSDNSFQFDSDPHAAHCPFQAHIRKTNPRGDTVRSNNAPIEVERLHRIVRRAFSFGIDGKSDVGLHFFCFQSDIGNQFEFMQSGWCNALHFAKMSTGLDATIGQAPGSVSPQAWPNVWGDLDKGTTTFNFGKWVSLLGGAYLFTPSISFLKGLVSH